MSLKKHLEEFDKNFDESLDYKVSSKDVVTFNSDGNIKFFKEQYKNELAEKDRVIENLKQELNSQWLTNQTAFNTKKLYEDKIKKMDIVDSTNLIPTLIEVSKQKQGDVKLDWMSWLEIPESNYLFQINESLAKKVFQENNLLIDRLRYKQRGGAPVVDKNYALSFSGDGSGATKTFVSTTFNPDTYSLWNGFTLSLWVRPDEEMTQQATILGTRASSPAARFHIGLSGVSNNIGLGVGGTEINGINNPMEVGKWHHLLVTYAGNDKGTGEKKLRMWVDNDPRITDKNNIAWGAQNEATETYTHSIFMGGRNTEGTGYSQGFACAIDEVAIYNTGFDTDGTFANEVYNAGFGYDHRKNSNLVGYWRFDEGSGTIVNDLSENNNHGTLTTDGTGLPIWEEIKGY